jgi:hypothetical protein
MSAYITPDGSLMNLDTTCCSTGLSKPRTSGV